LAIANCPLNNIQLMNMLDTRFFSLPRPGCLTAETVATDHVDLRFETNGFRGKITICTHVLAPEQDSYDDHESPGSDWHYLRQHSPRAHKNEDFEEFFRHCIMFPNCEEDANEVPTQTGDIEGCFSVGAYQVTPDGHLRYLVGIDVDFYHYIVFNCSYDKIDGAVRLNENGLPAKKDQQALNNVYHYYITILNRLHIKEDAVRADSLRIDEHFEERERAADVRRQFHVSRYPTAEEQAADPFHLRHYPEEFARFERAVAKYPNIDNTARDGLYANARLAIAYITEAEDDYSQVGNTRFFGLPDLPPGTKYPMMGKNSADYAEHEVDGNLCRFIAQINFAELKGMCDYLPERGILYLFVDSIWDEAVFPYKFFFYEGDAGELQKARDLNVRAADIYDVVAYEGKDEDEEDYEMEPGYRMRIVPFATVYENGEELWEEDYERGRYAYPPVIYDAPVKAINEELRAEKNIRSTNRGYWAHSADVQQTNGTVYWEHHGGPYLLAAEALGGSPEDYAMLLCVESFGADADELHVMIAKEDLKNRDFSRLFVDCTWSRDAY